MSFSGRCAVYFGLLSFFGNWQSADSSKVLMVASTPSHSHQIQFKVLAKELLLRGHQVVIITTDPVHPPNQAPQNLTEIDIHDVSYKFMTDSFKKIIPKAGQPNDFLDLLKVSCEIFYDMFSLQMQTKAVRDLLADQTQKFDLVITEAWVYQSLALTHIYNDPIILMRTTGIEDEMYEDAGVPIHPIIYPDIANTRRYNLSSWEHVNSLYARVKFHYMLNEVVEKQATRVKEMFGADIPSVREMRRRSGAQFVSYHHIWENYRPLPLNVVHIAGLHLTPPKDLPEELKTLMDSSDHGVIYISFGCSMNPSLLPPERMKIFAGVFSTLPYDVIWRWKGESPAVSKNVHSFSWLPQPDLLRHEKLLLFITQGGLRSIEEALIAGVPLLGIPLMNDQWLNVENCERLGMGLKLDLHTLTENQLREAIVLLINDKRYRKNAVRVGREMHDQRQTALERAVWWSERAMRLRGRHLDTPAPPLTWDGLLQTLLLVFIIVPFVLILLAVFVYRVMKGVALKVRSMCSRLLFSILGYSW